MSAAAAAPFRALLHRDLLLGLRHRSALVNPIIFYLLTAFLFALALEQRGAASPQLGAAVIWVAALLASTLSLPVLFESDHEDGSLEQLLLAPAPLWLIVAGKAAAHWLLTGLPLVAAALLVALMFRIPPAAALPLLLTLLLGTPVLSLTGAALAALTVGLRGSGLLLPLLVLPLNVPVLLFALAAVDNAVKGLPIRAEIYMLAALAVLAATIMLPAAAAALRIRLG